MSNQTIDAVLRKRFKSELGNISFSSKAKARMASVIDEKVDVQRKREGVETAQTVKDHKRPVLKFTIAACIAATLCVSTIAYASGSLVSLQEAIHAIFNGSPAPTEIVNKIGHPIGAADTQNGVTVSADAVIADGQNYAIVYSIQKDDGSAFPVMTPNEYGFLPIICEGQSTDIVGVYDLGSDRVQGANGSSYFYDADPADNSIQMVEQMSVHSGANSLIGRTAHADFGNFLLVEASYEDPIVLAEGNWKLDFKINSEDTTVNMAADKMFDAPAGQATMDDLKLSAIAINMRYTFEPGFDIDNNTQTLSEMLLAGDVSIIMDDGTSLFVRNLGGIGAAEQEDGSVLCDQNLFLPRIIDPEHVVNVIVGGTEFLI